MSYFDKYSNKYHQDAEVGFHPHFFGSRLAGRAARGPMHLLHHHPLPPPERFTLLLRPVPGA